MKKVIGFFALILIVVFLCSGVLADFTKFMAWLFFLEQTQPDISIYGEIVVRVLTVFVSFGLVGVLFNAFGWFNSRAMALVYSIVSIIISFALSFTVWMIEQYIIAICIVFGFVVIAILAYFIITFLIKKRKNKKRRE